MAFDTRLLTGVGVLAAVTEAGNFARAAEMLGLTPSGVSRAVARLEARVGVRLFDRNPREVSLTEEGRRFHGQVMPLLAGLDEAAAEAAGAAAIVRGRLRVSVDPWFARMVLASRLQQFLVRYPLLSLDFSTSNYREEMMAGIDVAVRFGQPDESSLIARKLLETPILTVAAPAYLERHGTPRSPHDLVHHEALLFRDPQTGLPFPWEFHRDGEIVDVKVSSRLVLDDPFVAVSACVAGQGIFQSLAIGLALFVERGELVPILPEWSEELYPLYAYHPSRHLPPAKVRAFLDFIQEVARNQASLCRQ
ncbi:LysR family transcriptional regulator [Mesorhizobium sp. B292B1B]|uniref:LysR family transcriptional regulator n=1 Tax=unclassified Mesorhizobium TaxID=325217 RepID=UPI0011281643|nr:MULTISPECIES: LysR family transcriptional regulator [unclassified Mesorhizobium]MBZ9921889.1 LysR family transcriptional regulator [Mesorhizobium sp. BR1-1-7]MBZ9967014.1 LysR family transcriptional regulator [Mesorhizobium sp. BR1-1-2]MCA0012130.1 LysR family transcriptional regulator [Mesorhizobium sp. B294B1A1]MCA0038384.1 LysR family transcriptional regulator [Mesorhizobium sp. B292B1B]TPM41208.1 LysR family transcriptional regulator [Mesorhizobium sp. B2-3-2]